MENSLLMRTEATFSLNFLVYIQNIYLNKKHNIIDFKFPYMPLEVVFKKDFELRYKTLWKEVSGEISEDPINDLKIYTKEKDSFYQRLFEETDDNLENFQFIYRSFDVWWNSFAGRFAIERSLDEKGHELYSKLMNAHVSTGFNPLKELKISLLFDQCLLADSEISPYFVVIYIEEFFLKFEELVSKVRLSIR